MGLASGHKPTNYEYILSSKRSKVSLGLPEDYPYDWFLGGVDSCQVSSCQCRNLVDLLLERLRLYEELIEFRLHKILQLFP